MQLGVGDGIGSEHLRPQLVRASGFDTLQERRDAALRDASLCYRDGLGEASAE